MKANQISGTIGGTFLSMVGMADWNNLLRTAILAAVGAVVSFLVSTLMKHLFKELLSERSQKKK